MPEQPDELTRRWAAFRGHADACGQCDRVRVSFLQGLDRAPDFHELWTRTCDDGRPLLEAWHVCVQEQVEVRRGRAAP